MATTGLRPSGLITPSGARQPPAGAITSPAYSPPSSCNDLTTSSSFTNELWLGYQPNCFPPNYSSVYIISSDRAYYSPAICPVGWTSYPWVDTDYGPSSISGETIMDCCQSGVTPNSAQYCGGSVTVPTTAQYETAGLFSSVLTVTVSTDILANLIQVRYQSSDCSVLGLCSSTTSTSSSSTSPTTSPTSSPSPSPSSSGGGGLSTGAKAAIGVVIPIVVIGALLLAFFLVRRRKQKRVGQNGIVADRQVPPMGMSPQQHQQQPAYYQGHPDMQQQQHQQYQNYAPMNQQQHFDKGMVAGEAAAVAPTYNGEHYANSNERFSPQHTSSTQMASPSVAPDPVYEAPGHDSNAPVAATSPEAPQFKAQPADDFYSPHVPSAPSGQGEADEAAAIKEELAQVRAERKRISTVEELTQKENELQERLKRVGVNSP